MGDMCSWLTKDREVTAWEFKDMLVYKHSTALQTCGIDELLNRFHSKDFAWFCRV